MSATDDTKIQHYKTTGHTYRKSVYDYHHPETTITSKRNRVKVYPSTVTEVSVTEIDDYFSESSFVLNGHVKGVLNSKEKWENVISDLERLAISKRKSYNHCTQITEITYGIPVTGYKMFDETNDKMDMGSHPNWFYWKGVYHDPSLIYMIHRIQLREFRLKVSFPRIARMPKFEESNIVELPFIPNRRQKSKKQHVAINHKSYNISGAGWKQTHDCKYLEVDLRSEQYVTHIGTAGRFPKTYTFPYINSSIEALCAYGISKDIDFQELTSVHESLRNYRRTVEIVINTDLPEYVTLFTVSYFDPKLRIWIKLPDPFNGNSDAVTEVVNSLGSYARKTGIFTRYLRIEPLNFVNNPYMRVAVYGHKFNNSSLGDIGESKDIEVVEYTVTPGVPNLYDVKRIESASISSRYYYSMEVIKPRNLKNHAIMQDINDDAADAFSDYSDFIPEEREYMGDYDDCWLTDDACDEKESNRKPIYLSDYIPKVADCDGEGYENDMYEGDEDDDMNVAIALSLSELDQNIEDNGVEETKQSSIHSAGFNDEHSDDTEYDEDDDYILI